MRCRWWIPHPAVGLFRSVRLISVGRYKFNVVLVQRHWRFGAIENHADGAVIAATANNDALPIGKTRASSRSARTHPEPRAYLRAQVVYRHAACSSAEMKKPPPGHSGDGFLARAHGCQKVRSNGARKW